MSGDLLSSSNVALAASGLVLAYLLKRYWDSASRPSYPPGPPGLPILGNILDMPRDRFVMRYLEWGKQYGPATWAVVPGRKFLILNTYEAMSELLDKRGSNYIDRPVGVMVNKLIGSNFTTGRRQGDAIWRKHRKFLRQALSMDTVKREYSGLFMTRATQFVHAVLLDPEDFLPRLKRILAETITELTYGALEDEDGTDYVTEHNENFRYSKIAAMAYLVDLFPPLRFVPAWFPGAQFRRDAIEWRHHCAMLRKRMIDGVDRRMAAKEGQPCYVSNNLEELYKQKETKGADISEDVQAVHDSGFSFFQAGADTSETTLKNFLLAMSLYPDVQAKAHKEIDQFFAEGRSPDFGFQDQMPYLRAIVLESLRWNPPVSFGVPHTSREDDFYNGYFIPKGTTVIANQWQVSRDPMIYDDPSTFNPDRFIDNPDILDPRDFVFGFGRRICPGNSLGYQLTWIFAASILWAFEIRRPERSPPLQRDADRFDFGLISAAFVNTPAFETMESSILSSGNVSLAASTLVLLYFLRKHWNSKDGPPLPPGPKGLPLIGNLLEFPRKQWVLTYLQWEEQYGPLTWVVVPGRNFLILNSYEAMRELLDKRGSIYIDRPRPVMISDLMKTDFTTPRLAGNSTWKRHRKFLRQALTVNIVKQEYSDLFLAKTSEYLQAILRNPDDFLHSLKRALGETISELTFGATKHHDGTDYVAKHEEHFAYSKRAAMGYLVDLFPLLRFIPSWFPGAKFKRDALEWGRHAAELRKILVEGVERRMANKEGRPCYVSNLLEDLHRLESETGEDIREDVQAVHNSGFSFYQAGSDTTEVVLKNFLLAMTLYPEVQARAREEVDRIYGEGYPRDLEGQDKMPFIHAVLLESMRWNPPVSSGLPHALREDDIYQGYLIPKGTTVIGNQWKISRDPTIYDDPSTFNPDRFIDNSEVLDPREFIFGFGRRTCPGNYLAYQLAWTFIVSVLWGFEMRRPEGEPPLDNDLDRFDLGLMSYPNPFRCHFIPRKSLEKGATLL